MDGGARGVVTRPPPARLGHEDGLEHPRIVGLLQNAEHVESPGAGQRASRVQHPLILGAHQHDRASERAVREVTEHLHAVHARHLQVAEHQAEVPRLGRQQGQRLGARGRLDEVPDVQALKLGPEDPERNRVVVNQEGGHAGPGPASTAWTASRTAGSAARKLS